MAESKEEKYWSNRYEEERTGWDLGAPSTPLKTYIDQLTDKEIRILIPGAGNGYEAEYLWNLGFKNITVLDISEIPLQAFKERNPDFPESNLVQANFFKHKGTYDLILEQTFFCSFPPIQMNRTKYATKMASLLSEKGKLVGVWFDIPLVKDEIEKRPFGGGKQEYLTYFKPYFDTKVFDRCYNSIPPREHTELFGIFIKIKRNSQANNPLHGITLKTMLEYLIEHEGWDKMVKNVKINCFYSNPSLNSSLKFLRKTPWAKEKVEAYYLKTIKKPG